MTLDEWVTGQQRRIQVGAGVCEPTTADQSVGGRQFNALICQMTKRLKDQRPMTMSAVAVELRRVASM